MSKGKIVTEFREALHEIPQTPQTRVPKQRLERALLEMRQLHSAAERGRSEAEELTKKQHETITAQETVIRDARIALDRQKALLDRMKRLLNGRMSGEALAAETDKLAGLFRAATLAVANKLGFTTPERRQVFYAAFGTHLQPIYEKHSHQTLDQANFYKHLLMVIIKQHGPIEIVEEPSPADSYLSWVNRDGLWHLRLSPNPEDESQPAPRPDTPLTRTQPKTDPVKTYLYRKAGGPDGIVEEMTVEEFLRLNPNRVIVAEDREGNRIEIPVPDVSCDACNAEITTSLFILEGNGYCPQCFKDNIAPHCTPLPSPTHFGMIEAMEGTVPPSGWILAQDTETGKQYWRDPKTLRKGDICSDLTQEQLDRLRKIADALHEHDHRPFEEWVDNFRRDRNPENEIQIYEALVDVYCAELKDRPQAGPQERFLVYSALVTATMSGDCSPERVVSMFPKTKKLSNLERVVKRYLERRGFGNQPERTNMDYQKYCDKISELMRADGLTQEQFIVVCGIMFLSGLDVVIPPEARKMPWFTKMESAVTGIVRAASKKAAGESIIVPDDWTLDA